MALEIAQFIAYDLPVGLVDSVLHTVELVAEGKPSIRYREGASEEYTLTSSDVNDEWTTVDMFINYYIDDSMTYSFQVFLAKFVQDLIDQSEFLEKCWSVETND